MASVGNNMDLNTIATVVAGVLTSLQSTPQANAQASSSSANGISSTPETSSARSVYFELPVIFLLS